MTGREGSSQEVRFGVFGFNLESLELRRQGQPVRLQHQPARVLAFLVQRAGRLVTREEIAGHLWSDTHVDFDQGLNNAVRHLRSTLGDRAESSVYIETVPRMGYRFIAPVERQASAQGHDPAEGHAPAESPAPLEGQFPEERHARGTPRGESFDAGGIERDRTAPRTAGSCVEDDHEAPAAQSQAGAEGQSTSRPPADPPADGRHFSRRPDEPERPVRWMNGVKGWVGLALLAILAAAGLWYLSGRAPNPVLQGEAPFQGDGEGPVSPAAQGAYLNALKMLSSQDFGVRRDSVKAFQEAVQLESSFAPARFHWALSTWLTAGESGVRRDLALERLEEAMAIAPDSPRVQLLRAEMAFYHEWDLELAFRHYRRTLELGEGLKEVHQSYGFFLAVLGETQAARRHAELALDLDASSADSHHIAGMIYLRSGDPRKAIELCRRVAEISDGRHWAVDCLLGAHLALDDAAGALQVLSEWLPSTDPPGEILQRIAEVKSDEEALNRHLRWRFHLLSEELQWTSLSPSRQRVELSVFGELSSHGRLALAAVRAGGEEFALKQLRDAHARQSPSFLRWAGSPAFHPLSHSGLQGLLEFSPLRAQSRAAPAASGDR